MSGAPNWLIDLGEYLIGGASFDLTSPLDHEALSAALAPQRDLSPSELHWRKVRGRVEGNEATLWLSDWYPPVFRTLLICRLSAAGSGTRLECRTRLNPSAYGVIAAAALLGLFSPTFWLAGAAIFIAGRYYARNDAANLIAFLKDTVRARYTRAG